VNAVRTMSFRVIALKFSGLVAVLIALGLVLGKVNNTGDTGDPETQSTPVASAPAPTPAAPAPAPSPKQPDCLDRFLELQGLSWDIVSALDSKRFVEEEIEARRKMGEPEPRKELEKIEETIRTTTSSRRVKAQEYLTHTECSAADRLKWKDTAEGR